MKDIHFHEILISENGHRVISADAKAYGIINSDTISAVEEYVVEEDRDNFIKNIELADSSWFHVEIKSGDDNHLYYVKADRNADDGMIRLVMVNIDELLEAHYRLNRQICAYKAQLDLFEDVFFEYNPERDTVNVFNTEIAEFDAGVYSLSDFEELLTQKVSGRKKNAVKGFITQLKGKTGRFTARIDANILNDDPNVTYTLLEEAFLYYDKETEGVVGHIHLGTEKVKTTATSIKHDSLTGLVDKTDITRIAKERIDERRLEGTTLVIIDIDFFKHINDTYGHQYGDDVIKRIADIITKEVGNEGIAGRFGGDEFLIVLYNVQSEDELRAKLKSIKNMVAASFPDRGIEENTPLSVSIGTATYPADADTYDDVFMLADHCLYLAKEKGRNRYVLYTLEKHGTLESIREKRLSIKKINERDLSYGDVIIKMFDMTLHGKGSTVEHFMDEFAQGFDFQHITLFVGQPFKRRYSTGTAALKNPAALDFMLGILNGDSLDTFIGDQKFIVVNRIETLPPYANGLKEFLKDLGIYSYVLLRFNDKDGRDCILIIASVGKNTQWNQMHYKFYRAFTDLLSLYSLDETENDRN
ncbi:GGDEF domain-containing protein [Butyrivibrio sp. VCB2006]|uniref:GGDEF domain-containing protein n=1 Tax=Butyrivibrio sp. VCB2006 TaxID=1280679 RepID=UPI0003FD9F02|nr:GGDEF domain-containing protein [Butyrivibrio sp. VCB2006]